MKKLMNSLVLSCRKATELLEKQSHFSLLTHETIQLIIHTSLCDACRQYQKQHKQLNDLLTRQGLKIKQKEGLPLLKLSQEAKAKIIGMISEK